VAGVPVVAGVSVPVAGVPVVVGAGPVVGVGVPAQVVLFAKA